MAEYQTGIQATDCPITWFRDLEFRIPRSVVPGSLLCSGARGDSAFTIRFIESVYLHIRVVNLIL